MSGHSKWAQTKRQKAVSDNKRSAVFTKVSNLITLAARSGGADSETNFRLRLAVEKARSVNMPKENIERAIKRGTGELEGVQIIERIYEGFGPGGIAMVIETTTDNSNRTTAEIKRALSKSGGSLSGPNSTLWKFDRKGIVRIKNISLSDELELSLIEAGADDLKQENEFLLIFTKPDELQNTKINIEKLGILIEESQMELVPKETTLIKDVHLQEQLEHLFDTLDEMSDVNEIYTNATW